MTKKPSLALTDLVGETFVLSPKAKHCGLYDQVIRLCNAAGFNPEVAQEAGEIQIMLGFIAEGIGLTLLPEHIIELARPGVVFRSLSDTSASVELALAHRASESSPVIERFAQIVRECASTVSRLPGAAAKPLRLLAT